jgi:shikimate kinase
VDAREQRPVVSGRARPLVTTDKIYLVGFMAAGKSTVARALAHRLHWRAEDVDDLIERRERLTVADIFARHGEPYFRRVEREMLRLLQPLRHVVVATGGGTFADPDNRALMALDGVSIWLDVPLADLIARIPPDGRRPLAADREQFERLYHARTEVYRLAQIRIAADRLPAAAVVDRILEAMADRPPTLDTPSRPV